MARQVKHSIGHDWSIVIDDAFIRSVQDGDVILRMPGRTVYISVFQTNDADAEEAIHRMIDGRPGVPVQIFDRSEPGIVGHGYLLPEENKGARYWGLNTWTAARGSVCCVTLYFQGFDDLNWAIATWKSVRPWRDSKGRLN